MRTTTLASRSAAVAMVLLCGFGQSQASDAPKPTRHQMMKDCMAKQRASDGGLPKQEMKRNCRDLIKTERENAKADKGDAAQPAGTASPSP